jgi:DNA-binding CsgD family transcriptional regulator
MEPIDALRGLAALRRRLRACATVGDLFACAAQLSCAEYRFERGVMLSISDGRLTVGESGVLADEPSDRLRRRVLAEPVSLPPGTREAELIRRVGSRPPRPPVGRKLPGRLECTLDLRQHALGLIAPASRALALLVVDRAEPAVTPSDEAALDAFAALVTAVLEHLLLRARIAELGGDLRQFTVFTQALMTEILTAPAVLPRGRGRASGFPLAEIVAPESARRLRDLLSEREAAVAALLLEGRSNREMADALMVSPETIKKHVTAILRKLGASNRVDAVARIIQLTRDPTVG